MATDSPNDHGANASQPAASNRLSLFPKPADQATINHLYAQGLLDRAGRLEALSILNPHKYWGLWAARIFNMLGAGLVLAGIVFFFAFNWFSLPAFIKLSLPQFGFVACLAGVVAPKLPRLVAQLCLIGASIFVGVFLAVFGQVYQTGADAYQLFMVWSLLIFGFALISQFAAHWVLWLVVANLFLSLWAGQTDFWGNYTSIMIWVQAMLLNGAILMAFEAFVGRATWLSAFWVRPLLVAAVLYPAFQTVWFWIALSSNSSESNIFAALFGVAVHLLMFGFYRMRQFQLFALSLVLISICILVLFQAGEILDDLTGFRDGGGYLLMLFLALAIFSAALYYLRRLHVRHIAPGEVK